MKTILSGFMARFNSEYDGDRLFWIIQTFFIITAAYCAYQLYILG